MPLGLSEIAQSRKHSRARAEQSSTQSYSQHSLTLLALRCDVSVLADAGRHAEFVVGQPADGPEGNAALLRWISEVSWQTDRFNGSVSEIA
jgi:hypothetical protein